MDKRRVLILCTGNSARSQMAEAIINRERAEQWEAVSAGTEPADRVNPHALEALAEIDIAASGAHPKSIDSFYGQPFDLVITVCDDAAERCPIWPGQGRRVHIGFPDPARAEGSEEDVRAAFRAVRDGIYARLLPVLDGV